MADINEKKPKRVKPELPAGFRDYGPAEAIAKQCMIDVIRTTFERFGFDPLETSSVQRTEVLTGGEEDSGKIIFNVKGSQEDESDSSLRFDLTVPLARFMAANPDLPKPFKRYQIGTVWRGERPQQGRYREFLQADVDIVGSSSIDADAEIAMIIYTVFKNLDIENFVINYNNRKILNALPAFAGFPEDRLWDALRIIDKVDKLGIERVEKEVEQEFGSEVAKRVTAFVFDSQGTREDTQNEVIDTYEMICKSLASCGCDYKKYFKFNLWLVRGLSYYTGSVFEVTLRDAPEIGSVCGGGRYDELVAQFTGQKIPAVGVSFGVDRLFAAMEKLGLLEKKQTLTQVLILQLDTDLKSEYLAMAKELRAAGINTALYLGPKDDPISAQLAYAGRKEIPYAVIYGTREKIKGEVVIKDVATRQEEPILQNQLVGYFKK